MNKITLLLLISLTVNLNLTFAQQKNTVNINGTYLTPKTSIIVELVVRKEVVKTGPYSRYSSQFLGVIAPLNDKEQYSIEAIKLKGSTYGQISKVAKKGDEQKQNFQRGHLLFDDSESMFLDRGIESTYSENGADKSLKTMAKEAAETIFKIRRRRFDLITGEFGENVFNAGMDAALKEMNKIEKNYIELFLGKNSIEYLTYQYEIIPEQGRENYMLCRFNKKNGIVDNQNITGTPVLLTTIDENRVVKEPTPKKQKKTDIPAKKYIVADVAFCKISIGKEIFAEKRISVYQFGEIGEKRIINTTK